MMMIRRDAYEAKAIAARRDRNAPVLQIALALLVTGLLIGQLLLLISP